MLEKEKEFKHRNIEIGKEPKHIENGEREREKQQQSEWKLSLDTNGPAEDWKTTKWCLGGHSGVIVNLTQIYAAIYDSARNTWNKPKMLDFILWSSKVHLPFQLLLFFGFALFLLSSHWLLFCATIINSQMRRRRRRRRRNTNTTANEPRRKKLEQDSEQ